MPNTIDSDGSTDNSTIPSSESTARDSGGHNRVSPAVPTLVSLGLFALVIVALMRIHEKLRGRRTPVMRTLPDHHVQPQLWDVTLAYAEDFGSREDASWEHVMVSSFWRSATLFDFRAINQPISAEFVSMPPHGSSTKHLASTRSHPRDCDGEYETWYQTRGKARLAVAIAMPAPRQQRTPDGPSSIAATPLCLGLIEVSCR
ncbi:hypothetical protein A0H81_12211 [Grifola frondosa]|uniref:Uncharacterized protein n=1 Tax=Grifola frondosa TaxID=5627 RepID=A0A1C7LST8_GRIFR|nr:hypothetical protein A0H81_12211 [Grifola frondosa]